MALRGKGAKGHHATPQPDKVPGGWSDAIAHLTEVQIWPWFDHDYHPATGISLTMGWDEGIFPECVARVPVSLWGSGG